MSRSKGLYYPTELLDSKSYNSLTLQQTRIYMEFLLKRQFPGKEKRKKNKWISGTIPITNNGKICFSYKEAEKRGFSRPTFRTAIDKLIEVGLIDMTKQGFGGVVRNGELTGECSTFAISERWRQYGTPIFEKVTRLKDCRSGRGWAAYHKKKK